ncbi:lipoprotein-releasing ABC transporter permease subunit [Bowmanella yangjiangensis]|uniref:Lipoprotein-releasing ABC transporter permease subunit n=1 Tax=Bowmanella yangjiangensis TaxID=2811230 RepID=A0ABS3CS10_9ALTE|nr:lipoprotein-releasing ABC transporter permease subunit [Bowmanella yangjiangensis]MBN7819921.1 lipoprotein-releasing ABC transporter permease subunit [Bowmanella yangjiangensis]
MNGNWRLSSQLAWRFRRSRGQSGFTSFISASSTVGIALGCCVMILLLSVMNGFERELKDRLLAVLPHGELLAVAPEGISDWRRQLEQLKEDSRVAYVAPVTKMAAMLQSAGKMNAVQVTGIDPGFTRPSRISLMTDPQQWQQFELQPNGILLGRGIMKKLGVEVGQKVQLLMPQQSDSQSFKPPKSVWFDVVGAAGIGGELIDNHLALVHLSKASDILGVTSGAQGLEFGFADPFRAPFLMRELGMAFEQYVYISDWTRTHGHLYQDIKLVRAVVYLVLTLLIAVACFNIVSTLVMAVNEKRREIAMLKTMGAKDNLIIRAFMLQGLFNGLIGTAFGVSAGLLLAWQLSFLAKALERLAGITLLSGDIYFIDFLPSQIHLTDVMVTTCIALGLSTVATLYPAIKAARIEPAKVLGH